MRRLLEIEFNKYFSFACDKRLEIFEMIHFNFIFFFFQKYLFEISTDFLANDHHILTTQQLSIGPFLNNCVSFKLNRFINYCIFSCKQ